MRNLRNRFFFALVPLAIFPLLLLEAGGCGLSDSDGTAEESGETEAEPATLSNLDQGFFSCIGRASGETTCPEFFLRETPSQRSYLYFAQEGSSLRVYDEDTSLVGNLDEGRLILSGEFAGYLPIFSSEDAERTEIQGYCRLQIREATYDLSFSSKDLLSATLQGTMANGSGELAPCDAHLDHLLPSDCFYKTTMTCRRVFEDGLTLEEVRNRQDALESHWEGQVASGELLSP